MGDFLDYLQSNGVREEVFKLCAASLGSLVAIGILCLLPVAAYYLLSLPLRRSERAGFFLDLLEQGVNAGRGVEEIVMGVSATGDPSLGYRFERVGEMIREGTPWPQALERVPNFLPRVVISTLQAGDRLGGIQRVIPLCRQLVADARCQTNATLQIFASVPWMVLPVLPMVAATLNVFVAPKFFELFRDMGIHRAAALSSLVPVSEALAVIQFGGSLLLGVIAVAYVGGPWIRRYLQLPSFPIFDACLWWGLPWHRKRVLRNFGSLLAAALDAGLAERDAIRIAADAADNRVLSWKAGRVIERLSQGVEFSTALAALRQDRELGWRLANSSRSRYGFVAALEGWWLSLDARAAKEQQTAGQLFAAGLLILSGISVGLMGLAYFLPIIELINEGVLW